MSDRIGRKFTGFATAQGHIKRGLSRLSHDGAMNKQVGWVLYVGLPV